MKNIITRCPLTIQYIMGINVIVYLLWKYHDNKNNSQFMIKNFTLSKDNHKRLWTWITSHFSHKRLSQGWKVSWTERIVDEIFEKKIVNY